MFIKALVYFLSVLLFLFGLIFILGSQGLIIRIVIGIILMGAAALIIYLTRTKPTQVTMVQKIDLSGDVNLEELKCKSCGASLSKKSVSVQAGAVFVNCEYCGSAYQIEEEPKW